ncbi:hypothetical protein PC115_g17276 [Phytophthora cactorum]|uniref:Reverse transcriptase domain-containing protein n=1 Tax=Phytophthora cactorum TaxID=29920 RepID=A0A8T1B8S1_9STRA|nr:hypothetical protein PC115_g17276 [Phytophthora cactorum]KAG3141209.1 hypothetical protein C6341_g19825 [Phytophthora cactorum]
MVSGIQDAYKCGAVVYAIPDEFDCILGISFVEDVQPQVDWRGRRIEGTGIKTLRWERTGEAYGPIEEGGPVIVSGLRRSVEAKDLSAKRPDPCRDAALETNVTSAAGPARDIAQEKSLCVVYEQQEDAPAGKGSAANDSGKSSGRGGTAGETEGSSSARGKDNVVEKMFTMGVVDESGVQTKYITRKKLRKFTRVKTKSRRDQPDTIGTAKAHCYLETDWDMFRSKAFDLLVEYKDNAFRPELPEGLPEKRNIEHRIDVMDANLAMYRQQWRQSPEQQRESIRWAQDMVKKKLIRPRISQHAALTFCVRKPVIWQIVHDYRYLNSNSGRQSIPMTGKEDTLDVISGAYWFSTMDLMSAYHQVRMRAEDIKFTAFQAPNGLWTLGVSCTAHGRL